MTQSIALVNESPREVAELRFTSEQLTLLKNTIAKGTTDDQFRLFIEVAQRTGLNPFAKQIYAVVRQGQMTVQTGVDGYRLIAQRTGEYAGQRGPEWCGPDGEWRDVWLDDIPPKAARVGVLRHGFLEPVWGVALTKSYQSSSSPLWKTMPEVMIAKCAEVLALRKAFPQELSGLYGEEEMHQADAEPMRTVQQPRRKSERPALPISQPHAQPFVHEDAIDGESREVDTETGEVGYQWNTSDLKKVLAERSLTMNDLSGVLGEPVTKDNAVGLINRWLDGNPGQTLHELATAAVEFHLGAAVEQPEPV